jgi:hypothetical protein
MSYIILECHGGAEYAIVVTDKNGDNLVFETYAGAEIEAADCQDGLIVEI